MIIIREDLVNSPVQIIAHQVNCRGVMDAGIAKQLAEKYKGLYKGYLDSIKGRVDGPPLGKAYVYDCWYEAVGTKMSRKIINVFGQDAYGRDGCYTNYDAVKRGFIDGIDYIREDEDIRPWNQLTIGIPFGIGCGLAGGNWDDMKKVLEELEKIKNVLFVAHKIP